jgi:hypothetical protein
MALFPQDSNVLRPGTMKRTAQLYSIQSGYGPILASHAGNVKSQFTRKAIRGPVFCHC